MNVSWPDLFTVLGTRDAGDEVARLVCPAWATTSNMKRSYRKERRRTVEKAQGPEGDRRAEGSVDQKDDRRNTNGLRGRWWAISMLANAKSDTSPKDTTGRVRRPGPNVVAPYPGRPAGPRGPTGVSKGHSSVDALRKRGGAKDRRIRNRHRDTPPRGANPNPRKQRRPRQRTGGTGGPAGRENHKSGRSRT